MLYRVTFILCNKVFYDTHFRAFTLEHSLDLLSIVPKCIALFSGTVFDAHALYRRELGGQAHLQSDLPQFYTQMESSTFRAARLWCRTGKQPDFQTN